jgi:DNA-binding NtrC family response regulator
MSVLLVCNEPSFRVVLGDLLRGEGYEVDVCRDLDGAKRRLQRTSYELVMLNLLDGSDAALRACQQLRSTRAEQKIAFIRGRWTAIPKEVCPHYLIPLSEDPEQMLQEVASILHHEGSPAPRYTRELTGQHR